MANKLLTMLQIRRLLQVLDSSLSRRQIAKQLSISRNTVDAYCQRFTTSGKSFGELLKLSDEELCDLIFSTTVYSRKDSRYERLSLRLAHYTSELGRTGVTRLLLWEEYRKEDPEGYSYQQFCEHLHTFNQVRNAVMHLHHKPIEKVEIDFAGKMLGYVDRSSGEVILCPVLVAVLPYSGYTYVEALHNATLDQLIGGLSRCLEFFEGVPQSLVTDNMRQMVKKTNRYEPSFTDLAQQWSVHYNTSLLATRPARPKDKSTVEKAVDLAYKRIYAPLRDQLFYSLPELNDHIKKGLDRHNNTLMQKKDYTRRERYLQDEKPLLKPLPAHPFEVKYSVMAKVQKNYHITLGQDWHHYSVPYQYIGKQVKVVYDSNLVEIFYEMKRITFHKRNYRKHGYTTLDIHMPEKHLRYKQAKGWDQEYFLKKASAVGESFTVVIKYLIGSRQFTEQTYNACLGLIRLSDNYGKQRLEAASALALKSGFVSYRTISNILSNNTDRQDPVGQDLNIPNHPNIRGPQTYLDF
jgi:transposase